jgi:2-polyprenyl-3-methyl-5-hydroxy-6-metoxy-1,4-benzoquinol methylase
MRVNNYKKIGIIGIIGKIKGSIIRMKEGKYSLKYAYDKGFFMDNLGDSRPMAEYLAPKLTKALNVKSLIDLGCATGHWVNSFVKSGVDVVGIEGGENAKSMLVCAPDRVIFADLREPLKIDRDFDMVLSIEVAEHIEPEFVHEYINNMVKFNPKVIMITAAPPGQGGDFHVNEQNKDYWDALFLNQGYKRAIAVENLVAKLVEEAKNEVNPPEIMRNPLVNHKGVYIPFWMPANLLVYSKNPADFEYLTENN